MNQRRHSHHGKEIARRGGSLCNVSQYDYPQDEFDVSEDGLPAPIGVHRAELPAWRNWLPLIVVVLAAVFLAWAVVQMLGNRNSDTDTDTQTATASVSATEAQSEAAQDTETSAEEETATATESASAEPTAEATEEEENVDYSTGVTVHNGTSTNGLAGRTGTTLQSNGFTNVSVSSGVYSYTSPTSSTIYYQSAEYLEAAQAAGEVLGINNLVESSSMAQSNPIVIVLRSDYSE